MFFGPAIAQLLQLQPFVTRDGSKDRFFTFSCREGGVLSPPSHSQLYSRLLSSITKQMYERVYKKSTLMMSQMSRGLTSFRRAQDNGMDIYGFPVVKETKLSDQTFGTSICLQAKLGLSKKLHFRYHLYLTSAKLASSPSCTLVKWTIQGYKSPLVRCSDVCTADKKY